MQKSKLKLRHELKHYINTTDYHALRQVLRHVTKPDVNAGKEGSYKIRSLYFDNFDDKVLREKLNGMSEREKFRIRFYNNDTSFIRIEKKAKINGLCTKQSTKVTRDECEALFKGDIEWLKARNDPLLYELYLKMNYQQLKPKVIVDYTREAYIYEAGNVRLTFDSNIRTGLNSLDFFNPELQMIKTGESIIFEIKYDNFIPEFICRMIRSEHRQVTAFSKYAVSRLY
jgi:hypothetical protein